MMMNKIHYTSSWSSYHTTTICSQQLPTKYLIPEQNCQPAKHKITADWNVMVPNVICVSDIVIQDSSRHVNREYIDILTASDTLCKLFHIQKMQPMSSLLKGWYYNLLEWTSCEGFCSLVIIIQHGVWQLTWKIYYDSDICLEFIQSLNKSPNETSPLKRNWNWY